MTLLPRLTRKRLALCALTSTLAACATPPPSIGPTLADLTPVAIPVKPEPVPDVSLDDIERHYRAALEVAQDPEIQHRIMVRLADMEMVRSEERQLDSTERQAYFADAIRLYQQLLDSEHALDVKSESGSERAENQTPPRARLLYQLAKAYALDGRMQASSRVLDQLAEEFPDSEFAPEANFRRAETAFSDGDYRRAERLYDRVLAAGQTPFYSNAVYMHGWSLFKQNKYREALESFTDTLDDVLVQGVAIEHLTQTRQNILADTLRIMSIAFSYLDGADTIDQMFAGDRARHYQHLLYLQLGDLYLESERYRDSADAYLSYTERFPDSDYAPQLAVRAIEAYEKGRFPSLARPAKAAFVRNYGVNSQYWALRGMLQQDPLLPHLRQYLDELANYHHAHGQDLQASSDVAEQEQASRHLLQAADYYKQFVVLFPMDEKVSDKSFLMAEAYYGGGALVEALVAYEKVAYHYMDSDRGADAAYAAILTLEQLLKTEKHDDVYQQWQAHKIRSAIAFADQYADDERAPAVLANAAEEVFRQGDIKRAATLATRLTEWQPTPSADVQRTAWLVRSHSLFDLALYSAAEEAYRQTLARLPDEAEEREQVVERIAASIYKQAEELLAAGDKRGAVRRLLQIREAAPSSDVAITAQYDAANHLIDMKHWQRAEDVLVDFRQRYPQHRLTATLPPKLAMIYQETGNWEAAARSLSTMAETEEEPAVQRESLFLAAELFEKSGNLNQAIVHYRRYAHTYPQPFDLATEARFHLVELYRETGEPAKRDYWLQKLIDAHQQASSNGGSTDRARYLAAFAAREFADRDYQAFRSIELKLPLKENLQRKKAAMEETLEGYRQLLDYGIAEFATEANHRIGMVYAQLSRDLMESERPEGLSPLELEQYEILLEEQAFPFEEKAIEIHAANAQRSWDGLYDQWVKESFEVLARLLPARYGKKEQRQEVASGIY